MQKKIIALAVASALTAPALAMADTTIYGVLDGGYADTATTVASGGEVKTALNGFGFSTMTSSRLGFLNTEDLGGGMKIMTRVETGIGSNANAGAHAATGTALQPTNGTTIDTTSLGSRELNIAVAMDQTNVKLGYGSTLVRDISLGYAPDPGGNLVGNILNADATNMSSNRATGLTLTQGFGSAMTGTVQLTERTQTADNTTDNKAGNGYLLGLQYADGPLSVAFAYQDQKNVVATTLGGTATSDAQRKITILGGSYDFGAAKLIGEYAQIKNDDSVASSKAKNSYLSIGGQAPVGEKFLAFAQISSGKVNYGSTGDADQTIKGYTVGGKYNMAKSTYGYASIGNIKQDEQVGTNPGYKIDQFALGLVHVF